MYEIRNCLNSTNCTNAMLTLKGLHKYLYQYNGFNSSDRGLGFQSAISNEVCHL